MVQLGHNQRNTTRATVTVLFLAVLAMAIAVATTLEQTGSVSPATPAESFEAVVRVPALSHGPVPGMPRSTYEALVVSSSFAPVQPAGMPDDVWDSITG